MRKKVFYLPIEPLDERYSEQWYRWFPREFQAQGASVETIDGDPLSNRVLTGTFLDINSTAHYKFHQLKKVAELFFSKKVQPGDVFFVGDIEFWGIEMIRYLSVLNKVPVKMSGFCHAASYTREDFMQPCESFAHNFERGWFDVFDTVFVGSEYHKRQIHNLRGIDLGKIVVSGNPYDIEEIRAPRADNIQNKKKTVLLTNRPDYEKRPNLSLDIFEILKSTTMSDYDFVVTTSRKQWGTGWIRQKALMLEERGVISIFEGITKSEYLDLLSQSKVVLSNSIEENFGYCILEALALDVAPVLSSGLSHSEIMNNNEAFLFETIDEALGKVKRASETKFSGCQYYSKYKDALFRIVASVMGY